MEADEEWDIRQLLHQKQYVSTTANEIKLLQSAIQIDQVKFMDGSGISKYKRR
jgi:hypothetical protein